MLYWIVWKTLVVQNAFNNKTVQTLSKEPWWAIRSSTLIVMHNLTPEMCRINPIFEVPHLTQCLPQDVLELIPIITVWWPSLNKPFSYRTCSEVVTSVCSTAGKNCHEIDMLLDLVGRCLLLYACSPEAHLTIWWGCEREGWRRGQCGHFLASSFLQHLARRVFTVRLPYP